MVVRDNFTFSELELWLNERRVTEIECLVPDLTGVARGKILPREKFTEDRGMRLPEAIVAIGVTGEFPLEGPYYDVIHSTDRDMHLRPDPSTVRIVPWAVDPTAQVIHDCFDRDGNIVPYAPRAALRHEMYATFMAKPMANEPGSAMHVHQSIVNKLTGGNIFSNEDGSPSKEFYWYIGGLQKYTPAAMALFAPYVNSYRRLARSTAAPINIQWGTDNRTVGIRSPVASPASRRIENRVIGADANPYVALAATLACGYLGMKNRIEPSAECTGDAYLSEYQLPRSLSEALNWLADEKELHDVLGREFITVYSEVKEIEHDEFMKVISPWEREHLLLHV